jgi:ABC-type microcin C transport system permease subunit YejB
MKKLLIVPTIAAVMATSLFAGEFADLHKVVMDARDSLVTMMKNKDKRGADQQKLVKDTANAVSAKISTMKAPAGAEKDFAEMSKNWSDFKKTREDELVPLIIAGKDAEAKKIGLGIQKTRLKKVLELCDKLNK